MIKTASEQLLDHPLVSFLQEAGLEPVGVYSEGSSRLFGLKKTASGRKTKEKTKEKTKKRESYNIHKYIGPAVGSMASSGLLGATLADKGKRLTGAKRGALAGALGAVVWKGTTLGYSKATGVPYKEVVASAGLRKTAALSLLSGIQVTPSTFDMRPGTRGYLPHERARLPHQSQRQTLRRISRMTQGPQFSGAMSPFNAQVSADRRFMNSFAKVSSAGTPAYQALKKVANPTAAVFNGPNLSQPSALMTSLTPTPGGQRVTSAKPSTGKRGLKKPKKLRAKNTASAVKLSSGLRELLLQKVAETPPAPPALRFDAQTQTVSPATAPSTTTSERTKASLKRSSPKLTDAVVRPIKKKDASTIRVNKVPRVSSLSTKGDSAMQPIVFKGGKNAPSGLKLKPGKVSGGPAVT